MTGRPTPSPSTPSSIAGPLGQWLATRLGVTGVTVTGMTRPRGGYSAETWLVDTAIDGAPRRFVVKRETPDPPIYPTQVPGLLVEVELQFRVMDALSRRPGIPIAPLIGYEADTSVLGQPFFTMEYVPGLILPENPPYTVVGPFSEASAEVRRGIVSNGLRLLAAVHEVDWQGGGLGWLWPRPDQPSHLRQLRIWELYGQAELRGRHHPEIAEGLRWLHAHEPRCGPPVFNWGDPRPGNIIYDGTRSRVCDGFRSGIDRAA